MKVKDFTLSDGTPGSLASMLPVSGHYSVQDIEFIVDLAENSSDLVRRLNELGLLPRFSLDTEDSDMIRIRCIDEFNSCHFLYVQKDAADEMTLERAKDLLKELILFDLEDSDVAYVKDVLDGIGMTDAEREELGLDVLEDDKDDDD